MPHDHDHHPQPNDHDANGLSEYEVLEIAVRELLIEKGVITAEEVNGQIDATDSKNPVLGAKLIARAWVDPAFKTRLVEDPHGTLAEMGIDVGTLAELNVVENTPDTHNVVVCTLCSCYPRMILGIPPAWYKSAAYRSRVVANPRGVLEEFGTKLPPEQKIRVYDSTADLRFLILPMRPPGTEGMAEDELAGLVTRDCMIGVALPKTPDRKDAA